MKSNTATQLRSGVIHGDLNSLNIIGEATNTGGMWRIPNIRTGLTYFIFSYSKRHN